MNLREATFAQALAFLAACGPDDGAVTAEASGSGDVSGNESTQGTSGPETSGSNDASSVETSATSQGDSETTWGSPDCPDVHDGDLEIVAGTDVEPYRFTSHVKGALSVEATSLQDLEFLSCLERVDGGVVIRGNQELLSLSGLERLESVGDPEFLEAWLLVDDNPLLTDLHAVSSLRDAYLVHVDGNASLVNLGLGGLQTLQLLRLGDCDPQGDPDDTANNASLTTIDGLESLIELREVEVGSQKNLTSLGRLHELAVAGAFTGGRYGSGGTFWQNTMLPYDEIELLAMETGYTFFGCENLGDPDPECECPPPD